MMFILKVPAGTDIYTMPEEVQAAVLSVKGQFPEAVMPGTEVEGGYQLVLIWAMSTSQVIESMIEALSLDWSILAAEDEVVVQADLLPFYVDKPVFDEEGNQIGTEPVTDLTNKIQTFAGRDWIYS